jgi:hypothetical protein
VRSAGVVNQQIHILAGKMIVQIVGTAKPFDIMGLLPQKIDKKFAQIYVVFDYRNFYSS